MSPLAEAPPADFRTDFKLTPGSEKHLPCWIGFIYCGREGPLVPTTTKARQEASPPEPALLGEHLGFSVRVPVRSKQVEPPILPKKLGDEQCNTQQFVSFVLQRLKFTCDTILFCFASCRLHQSKHACQRTIYPAATCKGLGYQQTRDTKQNG